MANWNQRNSRNDDEPIYRSEDRRGIYGSATQSDRTYDPNRYRSLEQNRDEDYDRFRGSNRSDADRNDRDLNRGSHDYGFGYGDRDRHSDPTFMQEMSRQDMSTSHVGKGPKGWKRSDDRIKEDVCEALERNSHVDASEIEVDVEGGLVILRGSVQDRRQKRMAEGAVEFLPGVHDVRNEISINQSLLEKAKEALTGEVPAERSSKKSSDRSVRSTH